VLDCDDAVLVELHALEDEAHELSLGGGVGLAYPEDREVFEHCQASVLGKSSKITFGLPVPPHS